MAPAWLSGLRTRLVQPGPPHPLMTTALPVGRLCTGAKSGVGERVEAGEGAVAAGLRDYAAALWPRPAVRSTPRALGEWPE